jgi:acylphosphatase
MSEPKKSCLHAIVRGRVQGVGFRFAAERQASALGLTGWVRNIADASLEVVAEGEEEKLLRLAEFLRQGPRGAFVSELKADWSDYTGRFRDFRVSF